MTTVNVINGPNLGRLGRRQPEVYGATTHDDLVALIEREACEIGLKAVVRQSDSEVELPCWIHQAADAGEPVVLNAGALTHTSWRCATPARNCTRRSSRCTSPMCMPAKSSGTAPT